MLGIPFGADQRALQLRQFLLRRTLRRVGPLGRFAPGRQGRVQLRKAIFRFQPRRFGRAFAARDETVPSPQAPVARDQPFARLQRAGIVFLHAMHQRQPRGELGRAIAHMGDQAEGNGGGGIGPGPEPTFHIARRRTQRGLGIAAQHGRQRALIARLHGNAVQRRRKCVFARRLFRPCLAIALEGLPLALDAGEFGAGGGGGACRFVARSGQPLAARLALGQDFASPGQRPLCGLGRLPRGGDGFVRGSFGAQRRALFFQPAGFGIQPRQPGFGLAHLGFGHAPLRLHSGMVGRGLGQGQLGRAAGLLGAFRGALELRPPRLVRRERGLARREIAFQGLERFGGVAGQPVGLEAVFLQPLLLAVEIGQPLLGRLELA